MEESHPGQRFLAIKIVMMPRDTNPYGTIFGGVLLSNIDMAGAVGADYEIRRSGWPGATLVTVNIKSVEFHRPVFVGDTVSFWTSLIRVGRTSITMRVDVEAQRRGEVVHLTEAEVTYVAIDPASTPRRTIPIRGE